jgi:pilus assembly protein FimV
LTLILLCLPAKGWALGVGNPTTLSALGESLNLRFPVSLTPGESLSADCAQAEVWVGDNQVPPQLLQLQVVGGIDSVISALLIQVVLPMQEPIVSITLKLGCPVKLTRQYTAFIDPPKAANTSSAALVQGPVQQQVGVSTAQLTQQPSSSAPRAALASADANLPTLQSVSGAGRSGVVKVIQPLRTAVAGETSEAGRQTASASRVVNTPPRSLAPASREVKAGASVVPKLRLEMPEPLDLLRQQVAFPGGTNKPDSSLQRLQQMEADLALLRQSNSRIEAQLLALKAQLAAAKPAPLLDPLALGLGLMLVALAGTGFFLWRSHRATLAAALYPSWRSEVPRAEPDASALAQRPGSGSAAAMRANNPTVLGAAAVAVTAAVATRASIQPDEMTLEFSKLIGSQLDQESSQSHAVLENAAQVSPACALIYDFQHEPLSVQFVDSSLHAAVPTLMGIRHEPGVASASGQTQTEIEDLIDLEQQVEFFLVLGQDGAAEELLLSRLNTGLTSALPYLKLLEIYQRLCRESSFEGMAARFALRFKARPPTWGTDLNLGQSLESYPDVLQALQAAWMSHDNAMLKVQALLSAGAEQPSGFDLPAYLDLLLLYSLARDLSKHEVRDEEIDLFLPLDVEAASPNVRSLMATMSWQGSPVEAGTAIDLDISLDALPPSKH